MTKTEIKKLVYKNNPAAHFLYINTGKAYYNTIIPETDLPLPEKIHFDKDTNNVVEVKFKEIHFEIPVDDMGTADFLPVMPAKHLLRWITETHA